MIPTSAAYKQAMNGPRTFLAQVTVTFRDETVEAWDNSRLMSLSFEEATSDTGTFTVGSAIIGKLSLSVLNHDDAYSELDFIDAVMQVKIGVETANGTEYMNRGIFTVDTARADSGAILITALDNLSKMDIPYQTASKLTYPATLDQIYRDACTSCGVYPATVGFLNDDFVVQNRPTEDYTCREILSAVATMAGCFAKADRNGEIMLGWYDGLKELLSKEDYDGGTFDSGEPSYETGDSLDGGVFDYGSPYYISGDSADGGSFSDTDDYFHLYSSSSQEIDIDDIEITGVEVLITTESDGETTTNTYLFGEEGYLISISENPLIQVYDEDMLMAVANKLIGMRFRKFSMSGRSDPAYETGDSGYVSDRKGNSYISILTSISFEVNGYEGFTCDAESVLERNMTRYNETARNFTKVVQKTEQMVNEEKTARELAIEQLTNRVNNSSGLFTTIETQSDGSKIFKLHDKPTLEESQIVWTMTAEAWTVSTNGGETPNAGMTVDGDTIVRILTATGINADWINSGTIRAINIVGSTISGAEIVGGTIRTATIEGYVDDNTFNEEIETVLDDIGALQEQSDKKAETWYQSSDPSTAWTTATLKQEHIGDIWYNTSASVQKSYRWNGSAWQEMKTSPPDEVFDEIDGKAQIFVSQPRPPYAVGDLWFNSTTSDIMTCINSRTSGSYTASDWQKRNKYTDDSLAEQVQDELQNMQIGGRNWLTNTESETVMEVNFPSGYVTTSSITTQYTPGSQTLAELGFKVGDTLTLSYDWEISNATTYGTFRTEFYGQTSSAEDRFIDRVPNSIITLSSSNTGGHLVFTFALTSSTINTKRFVFRIDDSVLTFAVRNLKLEKGNKATDWSPAPEDTETYVDNIAADLQDQIDGKVQTYSQTSDPSSAWTTTALKTQHTGDLWYNPSTKLTRRWSGSAWVTLESAEAEEAAELAQTKAQIFISTPTVPYYQGDLWFNNTTSDIMTCIRNRTSGSYTASDWQKRNKYTDDTKANAAQQTANNAQQAANSASTLANQAKSAADTANANANQASQMAEAVRQDLAVSGAVEINGGNIKSDTVNAMLVDAGVLVGLVISNGNGTFYVDAQGNLTATKATIKGNIEATGGKVGFLEIQGDTLSSNAILFQDSATDPLFILNGNTSGGIKSAVLSSKGIGFNGRNTSSTGWDITLNTNADSGTSTNYPLLEFDRYESGVRQEYLLLSKNELRKYMTSGDPDFTMSFGSMTIFFVGGDIMMMSASGKKIYINGTPF